MQAAELPFDAELKALTTTVLTEARQTRQRRTLVIAGDADWCHDLAAQITALAKSPRVTWLSNRRLANADVQPMSAAKTLLGQERDTIVFDAHAGFDADAFGAVSGVVCGGGLLLLLCPPLAQWEHVADPAAERIAVWPHAFADVGGRFLRRIACILAASPHVTLIEQGQPLPVLPETELTQRPVEAEDTILRTKDQRLAVEMIERVMAGDRQPPLVLEADRGRGKTAALGIAAAQLLQTCALRIVVTAPRPAAVQPLFAQAQKLLPDARLSNNALQWGDGSLQFVAPDALCLSDVLADLLLVDEAAAIPASLLQQLLARYPRIVFSTTTHGYEGTGRGFAVRFKQTLDEQTPGWQAIKLHSPIRWAEDDPLEALVFKTLLLNAGSAEDALVAAATVNNVVTEKIDRDALLNDEPLLSQLFGLLVVAHYRTRPNDLRNLLDGPGLSVYVSRYRGQVVATALVAAEGGFDVQTIEAIYAGARRPRGHLLAQSLVTHAGLKTAGGLRCARVMRIAVHPAVQRQGLGRQLLRTIKKEAEQQDVDLLGTSFGATESLLHFWQREKVLPVRLGFRRGHASGEYAVLMVTALSAAGEKVSAAARARFKRDLPQWLADPLQALDATLADCLQQSTDDGSREGLPVSHDREMLLSFAKAERSYEDALGPLWRLLVAADRPVTDSAVGREDQVLLAKVRQRQSWAAVAEQFDLTGKAEVLAVLRDAVAQHLK